MTTGDIGRADRARRRARSGTRKRKGRLPALPESGQPGGAARSRRGARRVLFFVFSAVPALLAVVFAGTLIGLQPTFADGRAAYDEGDFSRASEVFAGQQDFNVVETWKAHFNAGTAAYRNGELYDAYEELETALEQVPFDHRCDVQTNRAIVLEAIGDAAMAESRRLTDLATELLRAEIARALGEEYDASLFDPDSDGNVYTSAELYQFAEEWEFEARFAYSQSLAALRDPACDPPPDDQMSEEEQEQSEAEQDAREEAQDRVDEKYSESQGLSDERREAQEQAMEESQPQPEPEPAEPEPGEGEPEPGEGEQGETEEERQEREEREAEEQRQREEEERQRELEERNEDANEGGSGGGGPRSDW